MPFNFSELTGLSRIKFDELSSDEMRLLKEHLRLNPELKPVVQLPNGDESHFVGFFTQAAGERLKQWVKTQQTDLKADS
jgi:hypothetical protein